VPHHAQQLGLGQSPNGPTWLRDGVPDVAVAAQTTVAPLRSGL